MNEEYAKKTIFGGRIAHGPLIFAMGIGLMFMTNTFEDSIIAWLGAENMVIPKPVKIGETIFVEASIKEKRETKKAERGIIISRYIIRNQKKEEVMAFDFKFMMHKRV